jgi:rare lipoprotein A
MRPSSLRPFSRRAIGVWLLCIALGSAAAAQSPRRHPRVQSGYATFYGKAFQGEETASGETFDRRELVAAHRSLPFDTIVKVTNLENRRTVRVRIIDRGPYGQNWAEGTIIDLSSGAAKQLGMLKEGQVRVRVEVVKFGPPAKPGADK